MSGGEAEIRLTIRESTSDDADFDLFRNGVLAVQVRAERVVVAVCEQLYMEGFE